MKIKDLKQKQLFSVRCPARGVAVGQPSELNSGGQRNARHPDRKYKSAESLENNTVQMDT